VTEDTPKRVKVRRVQPAESPGAPRPRQVRAVSGSGCLLAVVLAILGLLASLVAIVVLVVSSVLSLVSHAVGLLFGGGLGGTKRSGSTGIQQDSNGNKIDGR
jgi:hypothetical protein